MKKHLIVILLLCMTFAAYAARKALVIGNATYTDAPLRNPVNDANLVSGKLTELGFTVTKVTNADQRAMDKALKGFVSGLTDSDEVVFYYSGHGANVDGINYLIPVGREIDDEEDLRYYAFNCNLAMGRLQNAGVSVMVLDACRDNPFRSVKSGSKGLINMQGKAGSQYIIFATEQGKTAADGSGKYSPFTESFVKYLGEPEPVELMMRKVITEVKAKTSDKQTPWAMGNLEVDFRFARSTDYVPTTVQPSETKAPKVQTVHHYGSIVVTSSREADVYFDGSFVGKVSSAASLEIRDVIVGNHSIEARCSDKSETKKIYVIKNEKSEVHFASTTESTPTKLQPEKTREQTVPSYGWIKVTSSKKADVYLDGVFKDKIYPSAYLMIENVAAGSRSLELRTSDNSKTKSLDVIENQVSTANFVWVPDNMIEVGGGIFKMGSKNENDEQPLHEVTLAPFLICRYEVTQAEWKHVMGSNPSHWKGDKLPVEQVSWYDILKYCNLRSLEEGFTPCYTIAGSLNPADWGEVPTSSNDTWDAVTCNFGANGYRLPTEAEWEFAARGGIKSEGYQYSGSQKLDSVAWYSDNSGNKTHKVGTKKANELGIYDMSGNLWEWCWDWYSDSYYGTSPKDNPAGPYTGNSRILRGGSWNITANSCRVSYRYGYDPYSSYYSYGFRVCRSAN